ncbi:MAG: hypothetical protein F6K47_10085 [Symploca sp. SIO2E6]|nr:hypothetical protein [Symploca sp. SIO2E6]
MAFKNMRLRGSEAGGRRKNDLTKVSSLITLEKEGSKAEGRRQKALREADLFFFFFLD